MLILKQYEIIKCNHYPSISAEKCFQQVLIKDKTKKYFLHHKFFFSIFIFQKKKKIFFI